MAVPRLQCQTLRMYYYVRYRWLESERWKRVGEGRNEMLRISEVSFTTDRHNYYGYKMNRNAPKIFSFPFIFLFCYTGRNHSGETDSTQFQNMEMQQQFSLGWIAFWIQRDEVGKAIWGRIYAVLLGTKYQ